MANVKTLNKRRTQANIKASDKKPGVSRAKVPAIRPSTNASIPRVGGGLPSLAEPSGGPITKSGSRAASILNDAIRQGPSIKDIGSGSSSQLRGRNLNLPSVDSILEDAQTKARTGARGIVGAGLTAYSPSVGENSDKPQNYPGEGLKPRAASPQVRSESSIPAPKKTAPKPAARKSKTSSSSDDDDFMADLRSSASRMKDATSDMASNTGRMKGAMEDFQSSFDDDSDGYKRGGRVGGRGDGKAVRGRTKGRFI